MLTEDQRMQMVYTGVTNCYCTERTLGRSTSHMLTLVSLTGLPILAAVPQVPIVLRCSIGLLGIALSIFWLFVNRRIRNRINYWLSCLAQMEPTETYLLVFRVFTGKESETIRKPPRIYAINLIPWILGLLWIGALVFTMLL